MIIRITLDAIMIKVHNDIIVIITFSILLSLQAGEVFRKEYTITIV
jgi:hypothetical protein